MYGRSRLGSFTHSDVYLIEGDGNTGPEDATVCNEFVSLKKNSMK
jgi:hypothetical protein